MFRYIGSFSREFDIGGGRRRELWFVFFSSLLNILFLVSFYSNYGFLPYYGLWMWHHPHERLRAILGLEAWKLTGTMSKLL